MKKSNFLILITAMMFILTNCIPSFTGSTPTSAIPVITNISVTDTQKSEPTKIAPISTVVPSPTWTALPTLSSTEAERMVISLLKSNGGCKLPCWWGIIPGQTSWGEAEHFLSTFAAEIRQGQEGSGQEADGYHLYTNYSVLYSIPGQITQGRILYEVRDGVIIGSSVKPEGNEFSYQLYQLLSSYGQPQAVYILTYLNVPANVIPFRVLVHYSDQGIYAIYEYPAENDGNTISSCPDSSGPSLYLSSPNQPYEKYLIPFEDAARRLMGVNENDPLVDLQTSTEMDIKVFYETFKDSETRVCFKTPANLWQ